MTSAFSIRAVEADYLVNGRYSCFVRQNQIVITDGLNEWVISQDNIDELEQSLAEQLETLNELETELANHGHSFEDITTTINNETKNLSQVLSDLQLSQAPVVHTHSISQINGLETELNSKAASSHTHGFNEVLLTTLNDDQCTTTTKTLSQVLDEREGVIRTLINGKANSSHGHNATEITFNEDRNVKQELDRINSRMSKTTAAGTAIDIFDVIFGTAADIGLQAEVSQLQTGLASLSSSFATHIGTYAVSNTTNDIMEVADDISDFSEVASEGRTWVDSLSDWFSRFRSHITSQTNRYTQIANNYTSPALQSVSNAEALADVDELALGLVSL